MAQIDGLTADRLRKAIQGAAPKTKSATVTSGEVTSDGADVFVLIDGATEPTPVTESAATVKRGDRVQVRIEGGYCIITGNLTDPAASSSEAEGVVDEIADLSGNVNTLTRTATETVSRIESVEGGFSEIKQTADALTSTVEGMDGRVSAVEQTAEQVSSTVSDLDGKYSKFEQTADGFLFVQDGSDVPVDEDTDLTAKITAAQTTATNAQTTANTASSNAADALTNANSALSTANSAQSDADYAYNLAVAAGKKASDYLYYSSSTGLVVGYGASSTMSGANTQITGSSVNIRSGSTNLASFTSSGVSFTGGGVSTSLTGGTVTIYYDDEDDGSEGTGAYTSATPASLSSAAGVNVTTGGASGANVSLNAMGTNGRISLAAKKGVSYSNGVYSVAACYKPGDYLWLTGTVVSGYVTSSGKTVRLSIPLCKPMLGVTGVVFYGLSYTQSDGTESSLIVRGNGSTVVKTRDQVNAATKEPTIKGQNQLNLSITFSSALSGITNNSAVGCVLTGYFYFS